MSVLRFRHFAMPQFCARWMRALEHLYINKDLVASFKHPTPHKQSKTFLLQTLKMARLQDILRG